MAKTEKTVPPTAPDEMELLQSISKGIGALAKEVQEVKADVAKVNERVDSIEKGGKDDFKNDAREEDVAAAAENRKGIDPRIVSIVDEVLGTDFGIELSPLGEDQLGYMFTLIVPERINDNQAEKRPLRDPVTGEYQKDSAGNVQMTDFRREDRRSKRVASAEGYGAIREHCEKVRAYMTAYYASKKQPMPQLHVK